MNKQSNAPNHDNQSVSISVLWILLTLALFTAFYLNVHTVPLFDLDEGAFSEATRDMLERGDYIATYLYGQPRYDKPILIYWLQSISVSALGLNEFALRLPSSISATLWILLIYFFMQRINGTPIALMSAIIGATTVSVVIIGKAATADAALNLFITGAMFSIFLYYRERQFYWILLAFLMMGLGFLTKGPVALVIPFLTSFVFFLIQGEWRTWLKAALNPAGILLMLIIVLPWYLAITWREGPGFITGFFLEHNLGRFNEPMEGHSGPIYFYLPVTLFILIPYSILLIYGLWRLRFQLKSDLARFILIWFMVVFIIFSLAATKLPHYMIYGITPLFILMALTLHNIKNSLFNSFILIFPSFFIVGLLLSFPYLITLSLQQVNDDWIQLVLQDHQQHFNIQWFIYFGALLFSIFAFIFLRKIQLCYRIFIIGIGLNIGIATLLLPVVAEVQQGPIKAAGLAAQNLPYTIVMWRMNNPSFNIYAQRGTERREPNPGEVAVTKQSSLELLDYYEILYSHRGTVLVRRLFSPEEHLHR